MARVEFYRVEAGKPIGVGQVLSTPFSIEHPVLAPGQYEFFARAFDDLGAPTDSARIGIEVIDLDGAILRRAEMEYADLSDASLIGATLTEACLINANLSGANLAGADLTGAKLDEAILTGAYLCDAILSGASLSGASYDENTQLPEGFDLARFKTNED